MRFRGLHSVIMLLLAVGVEPEEVAAVLPLRDPDPEPPPDKAAAELERLLQGPEMLPQDPERPGLGLVMSQPLQAAITVTLPLPDVAEDAG